MGTWWARLLKSFGRRKLDSAEVAAGMLAVVMPSGAMSEAEIATLGATGQAADIVRDELGFLRIFAAFHATRELGRAPELREAFWLFFSEMNDAPLSNETLAAFQATQVEYDNLALAGVPDGPHQLQEVGNIFAARIGRPRDPIAAAVGAAHFAMAYRVASDFTRRVVLGSKENAARALADLRERQRRRLGELRE